LLDRPKQGFGIPLQEWMQGALKGRVRDAVSRFCKATDLLDPAAVRETLDRGTPSQAWYLYNLALWWEQHVAA
jgi:asparagine synthase (glutamine-hydrolysing)